VFVTARATDAFTAAGTVALDPLPLAPVLEPPLEEVVEVVPLRLLETSTALAPATAAVEVALEDTPPLMQAPQPEHGPSGQLPVGGSPEAVVVAAAREVVVVSFGLVVTVVVVPAAAVWDCDRSQMLSPLVST
jgi:hypothetical protein